MSCVTSLGGQSRHVAQRDSEPVLQPAVQCAHHPPSQCDLGGVHVSSRSEHVGQVDQSAGLPTGSWSNGHAFHGQAVGIVEPSLHQSNGS